MKQEEKKNPPNKEWKKMQQKEYQGHKKRIYSLGWNASGTKLVTSSSDHTVRLWSMREDGLEKGHELKGHSDSVKCIAWHPVDSNLLVVTGSNDKILKLWDIRAYKQAARVEKTKSGSLNLAWSPSGHLLGAGNRENVLQFFDGKQLKNQGEFYDGETQINEFQWDVTGNVIFITTLTGQIYLLDGQKPVKEKGGKEEILDKLGGHTTLCETIAVDKTGNFVASGGPDALVCLWNATELYIEKTISDLQFPVRNLSFSSDGRYLATSSQDLCIAIYDLLGSGESSQEEFDNHFAGLDEPQRVHTIQTNTCMDIVDWNPQGLYLAYGGEDKKDDGSVHLFGSF